MGCLAMLRNAVLLLLVCICGLRAQDLSGIEIHGFATQGLLYSTHNNYLTMQTSSGSLQWTHGAISVSDSLSDNLRVGIQLHMYQLGQLGGPNIQVDWASGDYKFNDQIGIRAGKVKTVIGLFNDSQDVDSVFLWSLLPESSYPPDNVGFFLAHLGGDVYGEIPLGHHRGALRYVGYAGQVNLDPNGGFLKQFSDRGIIFGSPPSGKTYGGDLRWLAPVTGLLIGASADVEALDGAGPMVGLHIAPFQIIALYSEFKRGKWNFDGQYSRGPFVDLITTPLGSLSLPFDVRSWYLMASYRVSGKLHVGSYYSHYVNAAENTSLPQNYAKDTVLSTRYDFNSYFYAKLEDHFVHGNGLGFYASSNPNGLRPNTNVLAAKIGFTF
jgi:hypothetical protein